MTFVGAIGFPDEVLIISDSRRSYKNNVLPAKDDLRKIFQLSPYLCLGYTTDDVDFTSELLKEITKFTQDKQNLKTNKLLKAIMLFADKKYTDLSKNKKKSPVIIFLYAGIDDKPLKMTSTKARLLNLRLQNEIGSIPDKLKTIKIIPGRKYVEIPKPTPLMAKQRFPTGKISSTRNWDFTVVGSGMGLENEIEKYYTKIIFFPGAFNKGIIISDLCEEYIRKSNIDIIGGTIQIFIIDKNGVRPVSYIQESGGKVKSKKYIDNNGNWVEEKEGKVYKIKQPPL